MSTNDSASKMKTADVVTPPDAATEWREVSLAHQALRLLLFYLAYIAAAGFGQLLGSLPESGITLWAPSGLFIATLTLSRTGHWPAWIAAGFAAEQTANLLWFHNPLPLAVILYIGNACEAVVGAWLIRRYLPETIRLRDLREVMILVVLGAVVAPVIGATAGSLALAYFGVQSFTSSWPLWWVGDATGVLILAPLIIAWAQDRKGFAEFSTARWIEAGMVVVAIGGISALSLSGILPSAYLVLPALLWASVRFETKGAVVSLVLIAAMTAIFAQTGIGAVGDEPGGHRIRPVLLQLFLAGSALTALVVAAVCNQYHQALRDLEAANDALERRVSERTAELRSSEDWLRAAVEAGDLGVWELDLTDNATTKRSLRHDHLFGYAEPQPDWSLDIAKQHIDPSDRASFEDAFQAALGGDGKLSTEFRIAWPDGSTHWLAASGRVTLDESGRPQRMVGVFRDVTGRKDREAHIRFLMQEVHHRAKNILSLVQAVAKRTTGATHEEFLMRFDERIQSLAASHDLLVEENWRGVGLEELVRAQLGHFVDLTRIRVSGPELVVKAAAAQAIGMALHELATNAGKYGALSTDDGKVEISWDLSGDPPGRWFALHWVEQGGPPVYVPTRQGFGYTIIDSMVRTALEAEVTVTFAPEGFRWAVHCPASSVSDA